MKRTFYLSIFISVGISSLLIINGIEWGRPENMDFLIFESEKEKNMLIKPMLNIYQDIWEGKSFYEDEYKVYNPEEKILVSDKKVKKAVVSCCRTYLLRSYGLDEEVPFNVLRNINISKRKFNPEYFGYGNLYIFTFGAFLYIGKILKIFNLKKNVAYYLKNYKEMSKIYFWSRLFNLIFFILCILIFSFFIKIPDDTLTPFHPLAIFSFSVFPPFIMWSHFVSPFIFGLLFGIISLVSIVKIFEKSDNKYFIISSFLIGLSSGILMSYLLLFPFLIFLLFFHHKKLDLFLKVVLTFILGFLIANPYILTSFNIFLKEIKWYLTSSEYSSLKISNIVDYFSHTLRVAFGIFPLLIIFTTLIPGVLHCEKEKILYYIFFIYLILVYGLKFPLFVRHSFLLYSYFIFIFFYSCINIRKKFHKMEIPLFLISTLFSLYLFFYGFAVSNNFKGENVRTSAGYFINRSIPYGTKIAFLQYPSPWRNPPFHFLHYTIISNPDFKKNIADFFIISKIEDVDGKIRKKIEKSYKLIAEFSKPIKIGKYCFLKYDFKNRDWMRVNPEIYIFKKREKR